MDLTGQDTRNRQEGENDFQNVLTDALIMMVDDEPLMMEVVKAYLEEVGYRKFVLVEDSTAAIKVLEETRPDILLLDLMMPGVSGFDILAAVRAHDTFSRLPVIIMTSSTDAESKLRALDLGVSDFLAKPLDKSELFMRVRNTLAAKAYQDQLAYYDPLTGLPNKKLFLERLEWSINEAKRFNEHLAMLVIAIDNFTRINATVGPSGGDDILKQISRRIQGTIRSVDLLGLSSESDSAKISLFRTEGTAFSLLLDRIKEEESAALVAERLLDAIREPIKVENTEIYVTASIGIATYPEEGNDSASLIQLASSAKDYTKARGGNSFQFSSQSINEMYNKRLSLETQLRKSLKNGNFILHYQPKVDVRTNTIRGLEALLRCNGEGGIIPPNVFIPLAEETGLIIPIGEWVLHEACTQLKKWHEGGRVPMTMSVNLSVKQFNAPSFLSSIKRIVSGSSIDPELLTLEITESLLLENIKGKISILNGLTDIGLKLSIDDFGTGYSSLRYLSHLPVTELKIDRSFIADAVHSSNNRAIVLSVIFMAHCLGLQTIAEGVETQEQLSFLRKERCDQYQGYLFSKPLPAEEIFPLLPPLT
ncbi:MAG: EAL domain-containing protein [Nitrospiraceae bacterium]|nr:MAG: EAL domain-containing protein [Nitrospiraceae bacterium]